jgi:NAD(P)-dependent dehydrogenase (short-subunit alcohol dehydrogenase family)
VLSGVRLTRKYLPGMLKKNWGRVIFISSESSQMIPTEMVHYGMTKTAQVAIARGLAQSVAATGVTVNSVLAGPPSPKGWAPSWIVSRGKTTFPKPTWKSGFSKRAGLLLS